MTGVAPSGLRDDDRTKEEVSQSFNMDSGLTLWRQLILRGVPTGEMKGDTITVSKIEMPKTDKK